ncbi:site-specific DNA recombinase [Pseudomonas phage vB_PaeM_USP_18]|nr:site-specific DNA recombinase [Pseudomonas phage vB_PaeM_USP_18]
MAGKKQFPNGTWQFTFKKAGVLDKPIYLTFDTEAEGDEYARKLEPLLAKGIVPTEFKAETRIYTIDGLVREYERNAHPSPKDQSALNVVVKQRGSTSVKAIDAAWVDDWISEMKRVEKIAPATIRARIGALARCADWGMRKGYLVMPDHPLRTLPDGYAQYTKTDEALAGIKREDVERDRRLESGEYEKILAVIDGGVLARKQRPLALEYPKAHRCLFVLAVESAMRMREMYTLTLDQVDLARRTVFLEKTKNGDKRQVPLSTVAAALLREYLAVRELPEGIPADSLFPWWDGQARTLPKISDYLSKRFLDIFEQAGALDLRFHDLRHEAVSRLFERTNLSESQIMKISGHKSHRMMMRYANLRGSDLAAALW